MPTEANTQLNFEIAYVLLIDAVGYSKLLIDEHREVQQQLSAVALTGESEKAVTLVEQLLTTPATDEITLTQLRSWRWEVLRSNPRFQKILAGAEPKTVY